MKKLSLKRKSFVKRLPKGYELRDVARSLKQAKALQKSTPKYYKAKIVSTGKARGKNKVVFPYHIATIKGVDANYA